MGGHKIELIYKDLSYDVIGCLFDVYNEVGSGHPEKTYQKAVAIAFKRKGLKFTKELYSKVEYGDEKVGAYYFDFLVEGKIVVELKVKKRLAQCDFDQLRKYLKTENIKLGILVAFTSEGVIFARVLNVY